MLRPHDPQMQQMFPYVFPIWSHYSEDANAEALIIIHIACHELLELLSFHFFIPPQKS